MKILSFLFFTSLIFATPIDQSIKDIQAKYKVIKELEAKMKIEKRDEASELSGEGSMMEIYRDGNEIKEIREEYFRESGKAKYSYFYENSKVFFILAEETNYSLPLMQPVEGMSKPKKTITEHRYYITNDALIKWVNTKKNIKSTSQEFKTREKEVLEIAKKAFKFALENKR